MLAMVAKLYAGALEESPDVPHVGWRVGAYVGRSCAVMPPLAFGASDVPDLAALADAAPYVDDPAMRCFASRLRLPAASEAVRYPFFQAHRAFESRRSHSSK